VLNRAAIGDAPALRAGWTRAKIIDGDQRPNWIGATPLEQGGRPVKPRRATALTSRLRSSAVGRKETVCFEPPGRQSGHRCLHNLEALINQRRRRVRRVRMG
jgi:hypothetical protein